MDLSEVTNLEKLESTILDDNHLPKKSLAVSLYVPPHKRNQNSIGYTKFALRHSSLEYSDDSESLHSINQPSTTSPPVCFRTSPDLQTNISIHEEQILDSHNGLSRALNIEQNSFKNTEEKNQLIFESGCIKSASRQSSLEYSDNSESLHSINQPSTTKLLTWDSPPVCFRTSPDLQTNTSIHEEQILDSYNGLPQALNIEQNSLRNTEDNNQPTSESGCIKFASRQSSLEYSDNSESLHSINQPSTTKLLTWDSPPVCFRTSPDLQTNTSIHEEQILDSHNGLPQALNIEQNSFKNTEEKNQPTSESSCTKFASRQSSLEYSDNSESLHSINQPSPTKLITWDSPPVCFRASPDLQTNTSIHEEQILDSHNGLPQALNIEHNSFKNTEEKNQPISESTVIGIHEPEIEQFQMYNTILEKEKSDIIDIQSSFGTEHTSENLFASKCNETSNSSISSSSSTGEAGDNVKKENDDDLIIQKILDLANAHVNVTFKAMLCELYSKKYSEHPPSIILLYTVLQGMNFLVSVKDESKINDVTTNVEGLSEKNTTFQVGNIEPKLLTSEDIGSRFLVKIYNCKSISEIWGKIMNATHLQRLDQLLKEMKNFYDSEKLVASSIKEGGFYAVFKDDFWHRVKCLKCNESTALVLFIDRGDEYTFSLKNIFELYDKFALLPAQAIKMSLSDLEDLSDCDETFIILNDKLHESTVNATMLFYCNEENSCKVKLYLNIYEENINIADLVIEQLFKTFLNPKNSIQTEEMIRVQVSSVNERRIFVQLIESKSYTYFVKLLKNVVTNYLDNKNLKHELQLNENKMYLVQSPKTKIWYRAKILKFKSESEVEASLIDTGKKICIKQGNFILLEKFSSILTKYPQQAIEVQVHELSNFYEHESLEHFRKLIKSTDTFLALFITKTLEKNNILTIRLFKKESNFFNSNSLTPINDNFLLNQKSQNKSTIEVRVKKSESADDEIMSNDLQKISKMRELLRSTPSLTSLSTVLAPLQILEDYCDVHVTLADNPSKFVIQLLSSKCDELKKLECELSDACTFYQGLPLTVKSLKIGQLYAAKYDENNYKWYRVYVLQLMTNTKSASVYYCDYGYYKEVPIENIVPLATQFHELPYQAVWAELYGIKPIFERWTIYDASRFKNLTQQKNFVCIIKGKKSFKPTSCQALMPITVETVYSLELVDTSTAEDIYITDVFVDERRAVKCSKIRNF